MTFLAVTFLIFLSYAVLILGITIGWWKLKSFKTNELKPGVKVSVIVAMRNENENVESLINSLVAQDYPSEFLEIILVDDHSTDSTALLVEELIARKNNSVNLKLISLHDEKTSGKKAAIHQGIQASTGELILITDADCAAGYHWISTVCEFYKLHHPKMILGPVSLSDGGSFFGKLQAIEFMSLIASAAGSCNAGFPILANGANIAFTRQAYESCGGFSGNLQYPSGDDMFLMMSVKKKFGAKSIRFLRSDDAIVNTAAIQQLKPFIRQRMRWVSKSRGYTDKILILTSGLVFAVNAWLVLTALSALLFPGNLKLFLILFLVKLIIDFPIMISFSRFQRKMRLLWLFPVLELINSVYTFFIGIAGNMNKYEWKGRKI